MSAICALHRLISPVTSSYDLNSVLNSDLKHTHTHTDTTHAHTHKIAQTNSCLVSTGHSFSTTVSGTGLFREEKTADVHNDERLNNEYVVSVYSINHHGLAIIYMLIWLKETTRYFPFVIFKISSVRTLDLVCEETLGSSTEHTSQVCSLLLCMS
jgi:hypothetical protein